MFSDIAEAFRSNGVIVSFIFMLAGALITYFFNKRLQHKSQIHEEEKRAREERRSNINTVLSLIDDVMQDGKKYWLSEDTSTRISLKVDLKYKLKQLGPLVQGLFTDPFYRSRAVDKVMALRQCITRDPFEYPNQNPSPEPKTAERIAEQAAVLKNYISEGK